VKPDTPKGEQPGTSEPALTLKSVLECPCTPKVFFKVRNDSDALFNHFNISLKCVDDLQLMKLATTSRGSRKYLVSLARCIENSVSLSSAQRQHALAFKEQGVKLFSLEKGGSYAVFNELLLQPTVQKYCVEDVVVHMPRLWRAHHANLNDFWKGMVKEASGARVTKSQSAGYQ
jgi:exonuclease 3'-5' domain-containing protein 1